MSKPSLSVTILGSNSAIPAFGRNPTSQVLTSAQHTYLIDCGEGTQTQMRRFGVKFQRIKAVFISHLHGDHYFGLIGLLNTMSLLGRKTELCIICPSSLKLVIDTMQSAGCARLDFKIEYVFTDTDDASGSKPIYSDKHIVVELIKLKHRIFCTGFIFKQQEKPREYLPEVGKRHGVMIKDIHRVKNGEDFITNDGTVISNSLLTKMPTPPKSYAFCTDTVPLQSTIDQAQGVDCLYHDSTFLSDQTERAKATYHSTAVQAARVAKAAQAGRLLLGHFSARYKDLTPFLTEAKQVFEKSTLGIEGETYLI